jgi:hypothetical protein
VPGSLRVLADLHNLAIDASAFQRDRKRQAGHTGANNEGRVDGVHEVHPTDLDKLLHADRH